MSKKAAAAAAAAASTMSIPEQQKMAPKEAQLFKQVLKLYEQKQYKKAMKLIDQILGKYPQNGETIAMKGLVFHGLKKKDEATVLIKKGVQLNIKSHVCWHVYGLLYRAEHKYADAVKCYLQALKYDPNNQQIMRDLANLQVQRRLYDGFTETRRKILVSKSNNRQNWIAYAIGTHLTGNYEKAISILDSFAKTQESDNKPGEREKKTVDEKYEDSELKLYRNQLLIESGQLDKAAAHLKEIESEVVDKQYWHEARGSLLIKLGKPAEAEAEYRVLLERNIDCYDYHTGLRASLGLAGTGGGGDIGYDEKQLTAVNAVYAGLLKQFPKAAAVIRLPLNWLRGTDFRAAVAPYIRERLRKGVPALFRDLRPLYANASKAAAIEELALSYLSELRSELRFTSADKPKSEAPSVLLWALYFAAHHFDHLGNTKRALELVNEGIEHTPTFVDNYVLKARIYRHAGDHVTAYQHMDFARKLDTQDRYLNTKCVRFALRAGALEEAQKTVSLFLRDANTAEKTGKEELNLSALFDMQAAWYELGIADCYIRQGDNAKALKKYSAIDKHFDDYAEDQFDYHTYCLRKMTLRAYISMIRWIDALRSHKFYFKSSKATIRTYLRLYDAAAASAAAAAAAAAKAAAGGGDGEDGDGDEKNQTAAEKKAAKLKKSLAASKLKKAKDEETKAKAAEEEAKKKADAKTPKTKLAEGKEEDPDPDGEALLKLDPITECVRHLKNLQLHLSEQIDTHLFAYEIYTRKQKPLLVWQALARGVAINASDPELHVAVCSFFAKWDRAVAAGTTDPTVTQVIAIERKQNSVLAHTTDLKAYNNAFAAKHTASAPHRLAVARVSIDLDPNSKSESAKLVSTIDASATIPVCESVLSFLTRLGNGTADAYRAAAHARYPFTPAFAPATNTATAATDSKS